MIDIYRTDIGYLNNGESNEYRKSGVNIEEGNKSVMSIKNLVKKTYNKNIVNNFGSFV